MLARFGCFEREVHRKKNFCQRIYNTKLQSLLIITFFFFLFACLHMTSEVQDAFNTYNYSFHYYVHFVQLKLLLMF